MHKIPPPFTHDQALARTVRLQALAPTEAVAATRIMDELDAAAKALETSPATAETAAALHRLAEIRWQLAYRYLALGFVAPGPSAYGLFSTASAAAERAADAADAAAGAPTLSAQEARLLHAADTAPNDDGAGREDHLLSLLRVIWDFQAHPELAEGRGGLVLAEAALRMLSLLAREDGDYPLELLIDAARRAVGANRPHVWAEALHPDKNDPLAEFAATFPDWAAAWQGEREEAEDDAAA